MNDYGQTISAFGTAGAPALFTGVTRDFSYADQRVRQLLPNMLGEYRALVQHSQKAAINFSAEVTSASTDFLNLANTAAMITITGIDTGVILVSRAVETWRLLQPKVCSITATHYPDMEAGAGGAAVSTLSVVTPTQTDLGILSPAAATIFSTFGFSHASGVVHGLELTQELTITEDPPSTDGKILSAHTYGYLKTISLDLLATDEPPETGTTLTITGAPTHALHFHIETAEKMFKFLGAMMYRVTAVGIPAITS